MLALILFFLIVIIILAFVLPGLATMGFAARSLKNGELSRKNRR